MILGRPVTYSYQLGTLCGHLGGCRNVSYCSGKKMFSKIRDKSVARRMTKNFKDFEFDKMCL